MFDSNFHKLICDRVRLTDMAVEDFGEYQALRDSAKVSCHVDQMHRRLMYHLVCEMPAILEDRIVIDQSWPRDWWEALKERWFPDWILRRFPVKYERVNVNRPVYKAVCPHLSTDPHGTHLEWLYRVDTGECTDTGSFKYVKLDWTVRGLEVFVRAPRSKEHLGRGAVGLANGILEDARDLGWEEHINERQGEQAGQGPASA